MKGRQRVEAIENSVKIVKIERRAKKMKLDGKAYMILKVVGTICTICGVVGELAGILTKDNELAEKVAEEVSKQLAERT